MRPGTDEVSSQSSFRLVDKGSKKAPRTHSMASAVVACSSTMRSLGKSAASLRRCVRNSFSALRTEMFCDGEISTAQPGSVLDSGRIHEPPATSRCLLTLDASLGTSPCKLSTIPTSSIALKTG
jgi:hypothetical protein